METKMTSSLDDSVIGKAEYDGFVSSRAKESSGWCLNFYFKIMKRTKKNLNSFPHICPKSKVKCKCLTVDTKDALSGETLEGRPLRAGIIPRGVQKGKGKHEGSTGSNEQRPRAPRCAANNGSFLFPGHMRF